MSVRNLDKIFNPKRIAVIGASDRPESVGFTVMHNLISAGFGGVVYPVNPKREAVHGVQTYPNVLAIPHPVDLAVICVPAATVAGVIDECGKANVRGLVVFSAGFREVGDAGRQLEDQVREAIRRYPGMRMIGPNCLGFIVPEMRLNASFASGMPASGHVAFVSQSGALCSSILDWAVTEQIGFSYFVSIGNALDVGFGDLIDYFAQDARTRAVILYVESISDVRDFMSAARAFARTKPIVAYKAGRFPESAQASASHTGAMAGEDAIYDAAFERAGIVRVWSIDDIFDCAELLARHRTPAGDRLAIITNAGGPGVMATDMLLARQGRMARVTDKTIQSLNGFLPPFWSHRNPIDVLGDAPPERFAKTTEEVLADENVDAAVVILSPQSMTDPTGTAEVVGQVAKRSSKPVLATWMGGRSVEAGLRLLDQAGVPSYHTPEQAVRAFMHLVSYARNKETLYETPRDIPVSFTLDRTRLKDLFDTILKQGHDVLSEAVSKMLLSAYEIPVTKPHFARSADEAVYQARHVGFPVVMKIQSPQITHKTEVKGILLDLANEQAVSEAFQRLTASVAQLRPDATIEGVTIQKMIVAPDGIEMITGMKKDPTFGAAIMVGRGGVGAELFGDRALGLPPLNERLARRMLESLKSWPLLVGYRGRPGVNVSALIEVLMRLSYLVADYPEIKELDINPLLVTPERVLALDARIVIDRQASEIPTRPYAHLAIRPYPEEYTQTVALKDGQSVVLRPIKPEDEPMWHELLAVSSAESIRSRFHALFKRTTHEMATRFCFIDYDREMAIAAEIKNADGRKLAAVGRLVADPDHDTAEYAILVADPWQGKGLGEMITAYCVEIARNWGLKRIYAETDPDNSRMIGVFRKLGFAVQPDSKDRIVYANLEIQ